MTHLAIRVGERAFSVELAGQVNAGRVNLVLYDRAVVARVPPDSLSQATTGWLIIDDRPFEIVIDQELRWIATEAGRFQLEMRDWEDVAVHALKGNGRVKATIPGQITRVFVALGQSVEPDQPLCVLEAMKMENEVRSPHAGLVSALPISVGCVVSRGQLLAEISNG